MNAATKQPTTTPGPWTIDDYGDVPAIRTDKGLVIVPKVWGTKADVRLIAAAPALLAALKSLKAYVGEPVYQQVGIEEIDYASASDYALAQVLSEVDAALAAAEGTTP